jgi:hypothetical protein
MRQAYYDLILVTTNPQLPVGSKIVESIRSRATGLPVLPPDIILLFHNSPPLLDTLKCRELGIMCMRRDFPQTVYEEARLVFWKRATRKYKAMIRVDYREGHHLVFAGLPPTHVEMGSQLTRFAVILLSGNGSYSLEYVADELGVCRQSVKKYFLDIRRAFARAQPQFDWDEIFWMERRPGGTVCGVRANVIWN